MGDGRYHLPSFANSLPQGHSLLTCLILSFSHRGFPYPGGPLPGAHHLEFTMPPLGLGYTTTDCTPLTTVRPQAWACTFSTHGLTPPLHTPPQSGGCSPWGRTVSLGSRAATCLSSDFMPLRTLHCTAALRMHLCLCAARTSAHITWVLYLPATGCLDHLSWSAPLSRRRIWDLALRTAHTSLHLSAMHNTTPLCFTLGSHHYTPLITGLNPTF